MHRDTRILLFSLFLLTIVIQPLINMYMFNGDSREHSSKAPVSARNTNNISENNTDLFDLLADINVKLDMLNQSLSNNSGTNPGNQQNDTIANKHPPVQPDEKTLSDTKHSLMDDMSRYDMTLPALLSDPRLATLPEQDKQEILTELTRRLDSGEIDKSSFLPGYKKKWLNADSCG